MVMSRFIKKCVVLFCIYIFCFLHFCYFGSNNPTNEVHMDERINNAAVYTSHLNDNSSHNEENNNVNNEKGKIDLFAHITVNDEKNIDVILNILSSKKGKNITKEDIKLYIKQFYNFVCNENNVDDVAEIKCDDEENYPFKNFKYEVTAHNYDKCINIFTEYEKKIYGIRFYILSGNVEYGIFVKKKIAGIIKSVRLSNGFHYDKKSDKWSAIPTYNNKKNVQNIWKKTGSKCGKMFQQVGNFCSSVKTGFKVAMELNDFYSKNEDKIHKIAGNVNEIVSNVDKLNGKLNNNTDNVNSNKNKDKLAEVVVETIVKVSEMAKESSKLLPTEPVVKEVKELGKNIMNLNGIPEHIKKDEDKLAYQISGFNAMLSFKNVQKSVRDFFCFNSLCSVCCKY